MSKRADTVFEIIEYEFAAGDGVFVAGSFPLMVRIGISFFVHRLIIADSREIPVTGGDGRETTRSCRRSLKHVVAITA